MKLGDRVVLTAAIDIGKCGPCGTVWRIFADNAVVVLFDGASGTETMPADSLRMIERQRHPDLNGEVR